MDAHVSGGHPALPVVVLAALGVLAAAGFGLTFDPAYFQSDSAQYLSTAKSLLAGHGPATTIVWTAEHHLIGGVPVAQMNFPPGYPMLVALVALLGLDLVPAALAVSIAGFCAVPILLYWLLRADGRGRGASFLLAGVWFVLPIAWFNVLACLSEMTYIVLTLLTLVCLRQSERHPAHWRAWLLLTGACAGLAFTVRYAAIALLVTLAAVLLARAAWRRDARALGALALVGAPAAAFVLVITVHNYALTGRIVGGLLSDEGNSLTTVLLSVYRSLSELSGFSKADLVRAAPAESLLVLLAGGALVWVARDVRVCVDRAAGRALRRETAAVVSLTYVVTSLSLFVVAAKLHVSGVVAPRYLLSLVPFALLLVPYGAAVLRVDVARRRAAAAALRWAAVIVFLVGQFDVVTSHSATLRQNRYHYIQGALQQPFGAGTLREFLSARITPGAPLLGNEAQLMGAVLDRPVVGLPGSSYTRTVWTEDETRRTVARYGVGWIVFFPDLLNAAEPDAANQAFFKSLKQGRVPSWLALTFESNGVRLYQVTQPGA